MNARESFECDCIVVGGGIIGLTIARRVASEGLHVVVLERARQIGTETSSRSNEVIHAGIYYRPGSPQAVLCTKGRDSLYAYCRSRGVPHAQIGKLVVATDDESIGWLEQMHARGHANGVPGLKMLSSGQARELEPQLHCSAALLSPYTGILDTHALMQAYRADAEAWGADIALANAFVSARPEGSGFRVETIAANGEQGTIRSRWLVNAAGIWATEVAAHIDGMPGERIPRRYLAKGAFFGLRGASAPFRHLIVPEPKSWRQGGIFTLDLAMRGRFGPDEEWVDDVDYGVEGWPTQRVYEVVRRYFPTVRADAITVDYAGIRPRLHGPGMPPADWMFQAEGEHGIPNLVNLFGFESPGITASLAIADTVFGVLNHHELPFECDRPQGMRNVVSDQWLAHKESKGSGGSPS